MRLSLIVRTVDDALQLAWNKKNFSGRLIYMAKGFLFLPFLLTERYVPKAGEGKTVNQSSAGEDVYPLF